MAQTLSCLQPPDSAPHSTLRSWRATRCAISRQAYGVSKSTLARHKAHVFEAVAVEVPGAAALAEETWTSLLAKA